MTKDGFTKTLNFMTPWEGVLMLVRGHINYIVKFIISLIKSTSLLMDINQKN